MSGEERVIVWLKLLAELLSLLYVIWMVWLMIPEHRRRLMVMQVMEAIRNGAEQLACRAGAQAISLEARTGHENYHLPYGLSLVANKAAKVYEKMRFA